jgi:hypothetical protein
LARPRRRAASGRWPLAHYAHAFRGVYRSIAGMAVEVDDGDGFDGDAGLWSGAVEGELGRHTQERASGQEGQGEYHVEGRADQSSLSS